MSSLPFIPNEGDTLDTIFVTVSSSFTLVGCCFIIFSYIYFKELREFNLKLVFILTLNDLVISLIFLISTHISRSYSEIVREALPFICSVPDTLLHYFFISSFFWSVAIAHTLLQVIAYNNMNVESVYYKFYHMVAWGIPFLLIFSLFLTRSLRHADCSRFDSLYPHLLFFIPLLVALLYNVVVCVIVTRKLKKDYSHYKAHSLKDTSIAGIAKTSSASSIVSSSFNEFVKIVGTPKIVRTSLLFLISFAFCWLWSLVVVVLIIVNPLGWHDSPTMTFFLRMSYIFTPLQGFLNSLIYGLHEDLWIKMKESMRNRWNYWVDPNNHYIDEYNPEQPSFNYETYYEEYSDIHRSASGGDIFIFNNDSTTIN
ncbi:G-protein-coupled receptor family protein [Heterostelium album PN500]|uniref:G-protein-coupled receptor family protein n=1 Tax=Heterostelium pallidum (strain ATCC 26659 / Pp 5 / PN500) TaxID=670386 RepID=D3BIM2_HETP5|nr:G-protein-coupled receptor family protein [Heterostelium album PN500]EFA78646.1 G-protein-coupled receptor family protein [Heterostelium album PN500]|eukprot:XP_020430770.1 G-protein-coupled receptor family protein [Heterostelium album PN500]